MSRGNFALRLPEDLKERALLQAAQAGVTLLTVDLTGDDPKRCVTTPRWTGGND